MLNNNENQNTQEQPEVVKVDAATFFNEKFKDLENKLVDSVQITSRQSSKLFEKMSNLMVETRQLSETFDQQAFNNAITLLKDKITVVQEENQANVNQILSYLEKMATLMLAQDNLPAGEIQVDSLGLNSVYEKFNALEARMTEALYLTNKQTTILFEKMHDLLANQEQPLSQAAAADLLKDIDNTERAIEEAHTESRQLTDALQIELLEEMHYAVQELCKGLDYELLASKIAEKLPQPESASVTFLPTATAPVEASIDYDMLTTKLVDSLQTIPVEVDSSNLEDKVIELLNNYLPAMATQFVNYDILVDKIIKKMPTAQTASEQVPAVAEVVFNEEQFTNRVVEQLGNMTESIINYDLLAEKLAQMQPTESKTVVVNDAAAQTVSIDESSLASKVVELLPEFINYAVITDIIEENAKTLQKNIQEKQNYIIDLLQQPAQTATVETAEEKVVQPVERVVTQVVTVDETAILERLMLEIPAMVEASFNYDILAEKLAEVMVQPAIHVEQPEFDYDTIVERLAAQMPTVQAEGVEVDYDTLAEKVAAYMPQATAQTAEVDYDTLAEKVAAYMPQATAQTVEIDYDTLAEKVAAYMPQATAQTVEIDYDTLAEKVAAYMPQATAQTAEVDYDALADKIVAHMPATTAQAAEIDYDMLVERLTSELKDSLVLPEVAATDASALDFAGMASTIAAQLGMQNREDTLSDTFIEKFNQMNDKIDRVQDDVNLIFNAYKLPEMTRLDKNIAIYTQNKEEENLVAVLLNANTLLAISENYYNSGNQEAADQTLNVLYNKLYTIKIQGASKIQFVLDTLTGYGIEKNFAEDKLIAFTDAVAAFSATYARYDSALAQAVVDTKFDLLQDVAQNKLDKSVLNELENIAQSDMTDTEAMLLGLKEELIALPLSIFINSNLPASYVEVTEDINLPIDALVEAIYDRLHGSIAEPKAEKKPIQIKRKRVLRPAIARDKMESLLPQDATLKIVHRKINLEKNEQSLFAQFSNNLQAK